MMQVAKCKSMVAKVDSKLWQKAPYGSSLVDVTSRPIGAHWHKISSGAALVSTYYAELRTVKTDVCIIPGSTSMNFRQVKVSSCVHVRAESYVQGDSHL